MEAQVGGAGAGGGAGVTDNNYVGGGMSEFYVEVNCPTCTYLNVGR